MMWNWLVWSRRYYWLVVWLYVILMVFFIDYKVVVLVSFNMVCIVIWMWFGDESKVWSGLDMLERIKVLIKVCGMEFGNEIWLNWLFKMVDMFFKGILYFRMLWVVWILKDFLILVYGEINKCSRIRVGSSRFKVMFVK